MHWKSFMFAPTAHKHKHIISLNIFSPLFKLMWKQFWPHKCIYSPWYIVSYLDCLDFVISILSWNLKALYSTPSRSHSSRICNTLYAGTSMVLRSPQPMEDILYVRAIGSSKVFLWGGLPGWYLNRFWQCCNSLIKWRLSMSLCPMIGTCGYNETRIAHHSVQN
jgi:hypothetical protein